MNTTDTLTITAPEGTQNIEMTREFQATREQLLAAHTDPELFAKWVGPKGYDMTITQFEAHHGGAYAFEHRNPEGNDFAFRGVFHGEPTVEGFSQTFEFMGAPGEVFFETFTFEDLGEGRSLLRAVSVAPSVEVRDAMVVDMESGVRDGYAKLDDLLASL
ncbi:SRPBCC family protein [Aeromicrobium panaciterrae]|uniref:SRPBCC domain-containing protein n=1 Tax=Aeromicrobium panaciterrae TaxID=363861 RepID=UPI0031DDFB11